MKIVIVARYGLGGVSTLALLLFVLLMAEGASLSAFFFLCAGAIAFLSVRQPSLLKCAAILTLIFAAVWSVPVYKMAYKNIGSVSMIRSVDRAQETVKNVVLKERGHLMA